MKRLFHLFILFTLLFFSLYTYVGILINSTTVDIVLALFFRLLSVYLLILTVDYTYKFVLYLKRKQKRKQKQNKKENKEQVNQVKLRAVVQDKDRLFRYNVELTDSTLLSCLNKLSSYCEQQEFKVIKLDIL